MSVSTYSGFRILIVFKPNLFSHSSKVHVLSIKVTLTVLCSGKVEDKLTYLFSLVNEPISGILIMSKFNAFVKELLSLAEVVGEGEYYRNDPQQVTMIFDLNQQVKLKDFLDVFISSKGTPVCFSFLMALTRMIDVERVVHPVTCEGCRRNGFTGFRYKCQKCYNYNLCQDCFWRGRSSGSHNSETHPCKEFCFWQSQSKELSNSLRRSFRCLPSERPFFVAKEEPIKKIDLKNVVPPSPIPRHHHLSHNRIVPEPFSRGSPAYASLPRIYLKGPLESTPIQNQVSSQSVDEEHHLVQLYIKKLSEKRSERKTDSDPSLFEERRQKVSQLEARNRQIMEEITRLKKSLPMRMAENRSPGMEPLYASELTALRLRKDELERHLTALQDSRSELLMQLESLMKLLKNHGNLLVSTPSSAASTLNRRSHQVPSEVSPHLNGNRGFKAPLNGLESVHPTSFSEIRGGISSDTEAYEEFGLEFNRRLRLRSEPKY